MATVHGQNNSAVLFAKALQYSVVSDSRTPRFLIATILGGSSEGVTPVPIPNTAVKPLSPDGTALATVWESRTPPN
jgi:hypothetical protein